MKKDTGGPEFIGIVDNKVVNQKDESTVRDGVTISDATSGVDSATSYSYTPQTNEWVSGNNVITYTATDKAGNTTTKQITITYKDPNVCFVAGTKVSTPRGLVNIEDLKVGDTVYSYNEETKRVEEKMILNTTINESESITKLTFEGGEEIENTPWHPYYGIGKGWKETKDLEVGDKILTQSGRKIRLIKINVTKTNPTKVYNMTVEDNHDYFVGRNKLLVHNFYTDGGCG